MTGKDGGDVEAQTSLTAADASSPSQQQSAGAAAPRKTSTGDHGPRRSSGGKHLHPHHHGAGLSREEGAQIVEVTEKHGTLYNAIPSMPLPVAVLCCIFNIVVPGLDTG